MTLPLDTEGGTRSRVRRGEKLYGVGDWFKALYVVRVGVLKSFIASDDGKIQVTGFLTAGNVTGLDGIDTGRHQCSVVGVAFADSEVYVMPFAQCERSWRESAHGQRAMRSTLAQEIVRSREHMIMLGTMRAEQRVAVFLLDLSERYGGLGGSHARFVLRMTRQDIGNYLGLKLETVSRMISRLQQDRVIEGAGKTMTVIDFPALWRISGRSNEYRGPTSKSVVGVDDPLMTVERGATRRAEREASALLQSTQA